MLYEKIGYYRKKNLLTQEDLAEKLCVSRQTIAKWERGVALPGLEYLVDLSQIFGITTDHLLKEDDCANKTNTSIILDSIVTFIVEAKRSTYAAKKNQVKPAREGSHEYRYSRDAFEYVDCFFGASQFAGQEYVYQNHHICWLMNYFGSVKSDAFSGEFLKEALMQVNEQHPYRGSEIYQRGEYIYTSKNIGNIDIFQGTEEIFYQGKSIYEGWFHGGKVQ